MNGQRVVGAWVDEAQTIEVEASGGPVKVSLPNPMPAGTRLAIRLKGRHRLPVEYNPLSYASESTLARCIIPEHGIHAASDPCPKHAPASYSMYFAKHRESGLNPASPAWIHRAEKWRLQ